MWRMRSGAWRVRLGSRLANTVANFCTYVDRLPSAVPNKEATTPPGGWRRPCRWRARTMRDSRLQIAFGRRYVSVFFFMHPRVPVTVKHRNIPGRVPYDVKGRTIELIKGVKESWSGVVYADGFAPNTPGPNVDPHVFSDLLPWHLSYCNIDGRTDKKIVRGHLPTGAPRNAVLSEVVAEGDLIVFGGVLSTHLFFVDTIICVSHVAVIPSTTNGELQIIDKLNEYWPSASRRPFTCFSAEDLQRFLRELRKSRTYRLGLVDGTPGGGHHATGVRPHRQIIGRRIEPASASRDQLLRDLLEGRGFNFIPLRQARVSEQVADQPGIFSARLDRIAARLLDRDTGVVALSPADGEEVIRTILLDADRLVLDQPFLEPTKLSH